MAHERMRHLLWCFHFLRARVADTEPLVELPVDGDVHVLVDRRRHYRACFFAVEGGQVAASADEAHTERSLADYHAPVHADRVKSAWARAVCTGSDSSTARDAISALTAASLSTSKSDSGRRWMN